METKDVWGPKLWSQIHRMSLNRDPPKFKKFLHSMDIPCNKCKFHFKEYIRSHPVTNDTVRWAIDFHNSVNRRLGKKVLSYKTAYALIKADNEQSNMVPQLCVISIFFGVLHWILK